MLNKNQTMANKLNNTSLSDYAQKVVKNTSFDIFSELFGACKTCEDVEQTCMALWNEEEKEELNILNDIFNI